jgi:hypothetical protein
VKHAQSADSSTAKIRRARLKPINYGGEKGVKSQVKCCQSTGGGKKIGVVVCRRRRATAASSRGIRPKSAALGFGGGSCPCCPRFSLLLLGSGTLTQRVIHLLLFLLLDPSFYVFWPILYLESREQRNVGDLENGTERRDIGGRREKHGALSEKARQNESSSFLTRRRELSRPASSSSHSRP